jgi:alkylated DNA repair dioxygenase AlkB
MSLGPTNFKIVSGMLGGDLLDFLGYYAYDRANSKDVMGDAQVPNTPALHDDPAMRNLLHYFLHDMKEHTGVGLSPTYSYLRVYKNGDVLHKHTDREDCEYSVSLTLKREPSDEIWPLYLQTDKTYAVSLEEGDGLIYKGIENPHWRKSFKGERLAQVFLHYVRRH